MGSSAGANLGWSTKKAEHGVWGEGLEVFEGLSFRGYIRALRILGFKA